MKKTRARALTKTSSRGSKLSSNLTPRQWEEIAGFHAHEIRRASLREVIDPHVPTKNIPELSMAEFYDLAIARLKLLPTDFQVAVMGFGLINKHRALAEVQGRTELGKHLANLQITLLQRLVRVAQDETASERKR